MVDSEVHPMIQLYSSLPRQISSNAYTLSVNGWHNSRESLRSATLRVNGNQVSHTPLIYCYNQSLDRLGYYQFNFIVLLDSLFQESSLEVTIEISGKSLQIDQSLGTIEIKQVPSHRQILRKRVAICMAMYNPDIKHFTAQLDSILNQSYLDYDLIIQDDGSDIDTFNLIDQMVADYPQIFLYRNEYNLGFYSNFEKILYRLGTEYTYVAYCDQDDIWERDKLQEQLDAITQDGTDLVYSDLAIYDDKGRCIQPTFWVDRSNHREDTVALLLNNVATGSTILFRSSLLPRLLPFPQRVVKTFHDHWTTYLASVIGSISYIDKPLVRYLQHDDNVTGFVRFKRVPLWKRLAGLLSLFIIGLKLLTRQNVSSLYPVLLEYQEVFNKNYQRLILYRIAAQADHQLGDTVGRDAWYHFKLSVRKFRKKIYLNNSDIAIFKALIIRLFLNLRERFFKQSELDE